MTKQSFDNTLTFPIDDDDSDEVDEVDTEASLANLSSSVAVAGDLSMHNTIMQDDDIANGAQRKISRNKRVKISKHGIPYPSLPAGVVKKLATKFARTAGNSKAKLNKETLEAVIQASDWFFEQVSDDLGVYAKHAGRKTIDESDIVTLMARYDLPEIK